MKLSTLIDNLVIGEFGQLGIKDDLLNGNYSQLVPSVNLGLTALHKRFNLLTDDVYIQQYEHIATYYLKDKYRASNTGSTETYKYIDDTVFQPFESDRLIAVVAIEDEVGNNLKFNDDNSTSNVYMPAYNAIQCSTPVSDNVWRVIYTKDHARIVLTEGFDPSEVEVDIPEAYLEPLLYYIASRSHSGTGTLNQVNDANTYLAKYEAACQDLDRYGLVQRDSLTNMKLEINGWV